MNLLRNLRDYENMHITLWLMKDACWLNEFKIAGLLIAAPTIAVALHLTWLHRKNRAEFLHNIAVVNWILANTVWMIGEFFFDDTLRPISAVFFALGFIVLAMYYLNFQPRKSKR